MRIGTYHNWVHKHYIVLVVLIKFRLYIQRAYISGWVTSGNDEDCLRDEFRIAIFSTSFQIAYP